VYALLARGFTEREPGLIRRAKMLLTRLLKRQDVYLEMAVAALLLGQTEEASQALELSGEHQSLAFIHEHSQGDPDLLPGLCLYSEHWLQSEVFPHFRDLVNQQVSLKEYFADEQLQSSLEALPPETEGVTDWEAIASDRLSKVASLGASTAAGERITTHPTLTYSPNQAANHTEASNPASTRENVNKRNFTSAANLENPSTYNLQTVPTAERVVQGTTAAEPQTNQVSERTVIQGSGTAKIPTTAETTTETDPSLRGISVPVSSRRAQRANRWSNWQDWLLSRRRGRSREVPVVVFAVIGVLGIGLSILLLSWIIQALSPKPAPQVQKPVEQIVPVPAPSPENNTAILSTAGPITPVVAEQVIQSWLDTKSKAFGSQHEIDALNNILVGPALSRSRRLAQATQNENKYRRYEHNIKEDSVKVVRTTANQARVEAQVSESAETLQGNEVIKRESYNSPNLRVRYDLVRQNGQWKIQSITTIKS
ncbi:MAG: ARC6/PARC6 family protein, partial [Phormidium sp.]